MRRQALFSPELIQYAVMLLGSLAVGGFVYALAMPWFNGEKKTSRRIEHIIASPAEGHHASPDNKRRKAVQEVLDELDKKHKEKSKLTLRRRLAMAGLSMKPPMFYLLSFVSMLVFGFLFLLITGKPIVAGAAAMVGLLGFPRWVLNYLSKKRQKKFIQEFANAIDIIVRGVKSGLPLNDCIGMIARESPDPVGPEFARIVEEQKVGVPLGKALERMYERMPLQEVNFMSIVITIQQSSGGNLAEALQNLSSVLRERKKLEGKVRAFSAEAKSSAMIIGALPIIVMGLVYLIKPGYMTVLFVEPVGNMLLAASAFWMMMGVLVMRKMINFDY
jgi:tight adherence protein B